MAHCGQNSVLIVGGVGCNRRLQEMMEVLVVAVVVVLVVAVVVGVLVLVMVPVLMLVVVIALRLSHFDAHSQPCTAHRASQPSV